MSEPQPIGLKKIFGLAPAGSRNDVTRAHGFA